MVVSIRGVARPTTHLANHHSQYSLINVFGMRCESRRNLGRQELTQSFNCEQLDQVVVEIQSLPARARVFVRTMSPQERKLRCRALLLLLASSPRVTDMTDRYNVHRTQTAATRSVSRHHRSTAPQPRNPKMRMKRTPPRRRHKITSTSQSTRSCRRRNRNAPLAAHRVRAMRRPPLAVMGPAAGPAYPGRCRRGSGRRTGWVVRARR